MAGTTVALFDGGAVGGEDIGKQTREVIRRITDALAQLGYGLEEVVRTRILRDGHKPMGGGKSSTW